MSPHLPCAPHRKEPDMSRETRSLLLAWTVAVVLVWTGASRGHCWELNGNALLADCADAIRVLDRGGRTTSMQEAYNYGLCRGYVGGVVQGNLPDATMCLADGVTDVQLIRIVMQYLRDRPQLLHHHQSTLILTAVRAAFPCPARGSDLTDELFGPASPASSTPPAPSNKRQR
jgi:hypothetical protein